MERVVEVIKAVARLVGLYGQRAVKVLQIMMVHFEEIAAATDQQQEKLTDQLTQLIEVLEILDEMIDQAKGEIMNK